APDAMQGTTLAVTPVPPAITSAVSTTFFIGSAGSFTVTAIGSPPLSLAESGTLPTGVTFNPATGILSGTPPANTAGTYPLTFMAGNGSGPDAVQDFTLTVPVEAPAITSAASTTFVIGSPGSVTVTAIAD